MKSTLSDFSLGYRSLDRLSRLDSLKEKAGNAAIWLFLGILIGLACR
jgi:hypothetical protein